jgi:hypothetical protein
VSYQSLFRVKMNMVCVCVFFFFNLYFCGKIVKVETTSQYPNCAFCGYFKRLKVRNS